LGCGAATDLEIVTNLRAPPEFSDFSSSHMENAPNQRPRT